MRQKSLAGTLVLVLAALGLTGSEAGAQRRRGFVTRPIYVPRYYFGFSYWPYYGYGPYFPYHSYYGPVYYGYYSASSIRIQVEPAEAEVFVDGYYAGTVNDFDGFFQRLYLSPGEHEIAIYLEGYRTVRKSLHLSPGSSFKIRYEMERLAPGETGEPRPEPHDPRPTAARSTAGQEPLETRRTTSPSRFGVVVLQVRPSGAEIWINGERWPSSAGSEPLTIHLPAGRHRVEIRKEGHDLFSSEVDVRPGETTELNVRLPSLRVGAG